MSDPGGRAPAGLRSFAAWSALLPKDRLVLASELEPGLRVLGLSLERATVGPHDLLAFRHERLKRSFVLVPGATLDLGLSDAEIEEIRRIVGPGEDADTAQEIGERWRPARRVSVEPFLVSRTPLLARSDAWLVAKLDPRAERPYFGEGDAPLHVTAAEARAVLDVHGEGARLLSEAEWELIARDAGASSWLVGGRMKDLADLEARVDSLYRDSAHRPGRSDGEGALGVWGMVFGEWVADGWHASFEGAPLDGSAWDPKPLPETTRGGGGATYPWQARFEAIGCHAAFRDPADGPRCTSGLRFALSLP